MARSSTSTNSPLSSAETGVDADAAGSSAPFKPNAGQELTAGETEVIAIFVQMIQVMGLPRSLGEIYGLLFATPQPLAFQDIADRLGLSKGSVSQGLKFLRTVGAINPVEVEGDRREFFEPVVELRALVSGFLNQRLNPQLEEWGGRAKKLKIEDFEKPETGNLKPEGEDGKPETGKLTECGSTERDSRIARDPAASAEWTTATGCPSGVGRSKPEGGTPDSETSSFRSQVSGLSAASGLSPQLSALGSTGLRSEASSDPQVSGFKSQAFSSADRKVLSGRLDKLKTWQKRANTVLPMIGKLLG